MKERKLGTTSVRKNQFGEWVVLCWDMDGVRWPEADYHTNDKQDAYQTRDRMEEKNREEKS